MAIRAGPATPPVASHWLFSQRRSISASTLARVLCAARGTAGRGCCAPVAGTGWPCAPSSAAASARERITTDRELNILPLRLVGEDRRLKIPFPHLLEEPLVLLAFLESGGVSRKVLEIGIVLFSEALFASGSSGLGSVLFGERRDHFVVHHLPGWFWGF